jgi:heme exporter protein CcmD
MTPSFTSIQDFLAMGDYGIYVWSAYGIFAAVFVWQLVQTRRTTKKLRRSDDR